MKKIFAASVIMGILSVLLSFCARKVTGFAQTYSVTVYPVLKGIFARISGIFPFSVSEAGLYFLLCFIPFCLIRWFKKPLFLLNGACFIAALLFFLFTVNCSINYYRNSFSYEAGFVVRSHSIDELYALCSDLVDNVNENVPQETDTPPSDAGNLSYFQNFPYLQKMGKEGQKAMKGLADQYPQFKSWYPYPKPLINPRLLSVQQLTGIYSPFTIEANYNSEIPDYNIPHTICHELSHLRGFMREDEANFIGILACTESDDAYFRYSGYLMAWVHAGNALAKADVESFYELHSQLCGQAVQDLQENNKYWDQYEGKVAEVSNQVNDTYLKLNDQKDGVQSYGRVVDLMLAMFLQNRQEAQ